MLRKFGVSRKCQLRRNECDDLPTVQEKLEDVFLGGARGKHVDSVRLLWRCAVVVGFYTDLRPANDTARERTDLTRRVWLSSSRCFQEGAKLRSIVAGE